MIEIGESEVESFAAEAVEVPRIKLPSGWPRAEIMVAGRAYAYERSYPVKGHSAVMPRYLSEQVEAGKEPLIVERGDRFYVYLATDA